MQPYVRISHSYPSYHQFKWNLPFKLWMEEISAGQGGQKSKSGKNGKLALLFEKSLDLLLDIFEVRSASESCSKLALFSYSLLSWHWWRRSCPDQIWISPSNIIIGELSKRLAQEHRAIWTSFAKKGCTYTEETLVTAIVSKVALCSQNHLLQSLLRLVHVG